MAKKIYKDDNFHHSGRLRTLMDLIKQYSEVYSLQYGCMHCDGGLRRREAVPESTKEQLERECEEMLNSIENGIDIMVVHAETKGFEEGYSIGPSI